MHEIYSISVQKNRIAKNDLFLILKNNFSGGMSF